MRVIKSVGLIALGVVLGLAGSTVGSRVEAQAAQVVQSESGIRPGLALQAGQPMGDIITSENIGFQLVASPNWGGVATGKFMVKVNGRWLPVAAPTGIFPAR